jgi:uncharacterized protein YndB with AHSA1/START domain
MPKLTPVDAAFIATARQVVEVKQLVRAPIQRVWDTIADNNSWTKWFSPMSECRSTSEPATGVGATRSVVVGALEADEEFVAWDEPNVWAFSIVKTNIPMATKFLEHVELATHNEGTLVTYTGAFDPHLVTKLSYPLVKRQIRKSWTTGLAGLADYLKP